MVSLHAESMRSSAPMVTRFVRTCRLRKELGRIGSSRRRGRPASLLHHSDQGSPCSGNVWRDSATPRSQLAPVSTEAGQSQSFHITMTIDRTVRWTN